MKNIALLVLLAMLPFTSSAQGILLNETNYDFWLGKWNAAWQNADGSEGSGTNYILKVLDGTVLEENFEITSGKQAGFKGMSHSVFNPNTKVWHQAWVDNQGGYFDFIGEVLADRKIFKTKPIEKDGKIIIQRMVFYDIEQDKFAWDWEGTEDGGATWNLLWRINYTRQH